MDVDNKVADDVAGQPLAVLGADRFRNLSRRGPALVAAGAPPVPTVAPVAQHTVVVAPGVKTPPRLSATLEVALSTAPCCDPHVVDTLTTPPARAATVALSGECVTGARPSPPDSVGAVGNCLEPPQEGFQALSLRLRSAQMQQNFQHAGAWKPSTTGLSAGSGEGDSLARTTEGVFTRSRMLSEAFDKKAKTGHPLFCENPSAANVPTVSDASFAKPNEVAAASGSSCPVVHQPVSNGEGCGFRRGKLAEWMELAVQHAPPSKTGRNTRALPGGLQDAYTRAVRYYLTDASLAAQQGAQKAPAPAPSACIRGIAGREKSLMLAILEVNEGLEGLILFVEVLEAQSGNAPTLNVGSIARLLLHRRHPVVQHCGEAWEPRPGQRLHVHGFSIIGANAGGRGPLLLPLDVLPAGAG